MRSLKITDTVLPPQRALPSPDGKSFFACADRKNPYAAQLELFRVPPGQPVYRETTDLFSWDMATWSRDGQYLACLGPQKAGPTVKFVAAADGSVANVSLGEVVASHTKSADEPAHIWRLAIDDTGERAAVGMGYAKFGLFVIVGRQSHTVEMVVDGLPDMVQALQFVGRDRLLTATSNGRAQLWDLGLRKPLWTTETGQEPLQFGSVPGGRYVVCTNLFRSGTVLRMEDGKIVYKTPPLLAGDSSLVLPFTQPRLIGRGDWALEMDADSMQLRLIELATGRTALTYSTLRDGQWMAYTPDGDWDGPEEARQWVRFCRGLKPLSPDEANSHRSRERIDAVMRAAFNESRK